MDVNTYAIEKIAAGRLAELRAAGRGVALLDSARLGPARGGRRSRVRPHPAGALARPGRHGRGAECRGAGRPLK